MMRKSSVRVFSISRAAMRMSLAWPCAPPSGWWIRTRECGSAARLPLVPAHRRTEPMEAAMPVQTVATSGWTICIVS